MDYLPGQTVPVFKPPVSLAEGIFVQRHQNLAARRQAFPYRIDFLRRAAPDMDRHGRIEFEQGPGADRHEWLSREFKGNKIAVTRRRVSEPRRVDDLRA